MRKLMVASLLLVSSIAAADSKPTPSADRDAKQLVTDDCALARKAGRTCVIDMGKEDIQGVVGRGDGHQVTGLTFHPNSSLIRLRKDYIAEIVKSAEDLD
jgi:hypothetical protein